ncbi:hypothetical protein QYE76_020400 [Lolium multiflorum]|uniref:Uncharacterized protein n=1 Tax=Lolium multiflorum TaxID=4521 RepID=A0AAD8VS57_LOLMU|nr:hypothetical protein QYE76_020400 [Lolium multiflorum]
MSHIPKNKKKSLNLLSKTMMLIKNHPPQPMVELKNDRVLARDEFVDHEGTIQKIKAASRASFQVRQLAKGTFISEEKYVKDMLKKFDMAKASPMKTPIPVKGQLGSCDGEKDVDIKILRADLCFAASPTRPHRLCSPAVACCGELVAADAPGAWTPPWLRRRGAGVATVPPWPGLAWRRRAPACAAVVAMAVPVYSTTVSAPPLFFSLLCFLSSFS